MRRSWIIAIVAVAGIAFAITAELIAASGIGASFADLATGLTIFACGLWGARQRPGELRWLLLAFAGVAWFAGNFVHAGSTAISSVGGALVYLHR
jgi:hypothetical protein